ncbi:hypothetical protein JCM8547_009246 [Rhodosporidiobolus lusitaniae]
MSSRTIAVIGATGHQGSGVVSALLSTTSFAVKAIARDPSSRKAQTLLDQHATAAWKGRLEVVKGDLTEPSTLEEALEGVQGVFASFGYLGRGGTEGEETEEAKQGKALVDVLEKLDVKHFVYSALPSIMKASEGKYTHASQFDSKAIVAEYAKKQLPAVTLLIPGVFYSNLSSPIYSQRQDDLSARFCMPVKQTTSLQWVDDRYDIGQFATAVFSAGPFNTAGKTYPVMSAPLTMPDLAQQYVAPTGEKATFDPLPLDEALGMTKRMTGNDMTLEFGDMFRFLDAVPPGTTAYGTLRPEEDTSFEDLGVKASTLAEFLERTGFRVGQ